MIGQVERLPPEFDRLSLPDPELSRDARVDSDKSRTFNIARTQIPVRARCRLREGGRVEVLTDTLVRSIRIRKHQVGSLVTANRLQRCINSGCYRKIVAGQDLCYT